MNLDWGGGVDVAWVLSVGLDSGSSFDSIRS